MPFNFFDLFSLSNILDIAIVSYLIYKAISWIRGTRAVQLLKGVFILVLVAIISNWFRLTTISWLLMQFQTVLFIALPLVFQPELRRMLERIGRGGFLSYRGILDQETLTRFNSEMIRAINVLSRNSIGALIVLERETMLNNYEETGITIDAIVTGELLVNLFEPKTPLHDGAVIIRGDRIVAAGCFLPLTENPNISKELGSRHRAALGITEVSDALALVVSEETGTISAVQEGRMTRYLDEESLHSILVEALSTDTKKQRFFPSFWR